MNQPRVTRIPLPCLLLLAGLALAPLFAADKTLGALGRLQPEAPVLTVVGPPGTGAVATVHVTDNDVVEEGTPLVTLSNHDEAAADVARAKAQVERVKAQVANSLAIQELDVKRQENVVAQATRARDQIETANQHRIAVARLRLQQAESAVNLAVENQKATARRGPLLIHEQELEIRDAEQKLALAKARLQSYEQVGGESIAPREMELREFQVKQAELGIEAATAGKDRAVSEAANARDRAAAELRDAEGRLAIARAEVDQLEANAPNDVANATGDIANAQAALDIANARLAQGRTDGKAAIEDAEEAVAQADKVLAMTIVRAPFGATVLDVLVGPGGPAGGRPLVRLADLSRIVAVSEVYEGDLLKVKPGLTATITSGALPQDVKGEVVSVSRQVDGRLRVGRVLVRLADAEAASRLLNHEVTVKIEL